MIGDGKNPGLYLLSAQDIFAYLDEHDDSKTIAVSYFEIYCGKVFDLLNSREKLAVREDAKQNVNVVGLTRHQILNAEGLFEKISHGNSIRVTSQTGKNNDSSRSHAILQIYIIEKSKIKGIMSFIDLAGNERGEDTKDHEAQTRHDGAEISKSLLALKECIRALDQDKKHVPFRGSKLTMVLKDSFVGKCKTVMIGNISPCLANCEYTLNTLRYADRVKELKKDAKDRPKVKGDDLMLARGNNTNKTDIKPEKNLGIIVTKFDQNDEVYKKNNKQGGGKKLDKLLSSESNPVKKNYPPQKIISKGESSQENLSGVEEDDQYSENHEVEDHPIANVDNRMQKKPLSRNPGQREQVVASKNQSFYQQPSNHSSSNGFNKVKSTEKKPEVVKNVDQATRKNMRPIPQKPSRKNDQDDFENLQEIHEKIQNHLLKEEDTILHKHNGHVRLMGNLNDIVI